MRDLTGMQVGVGWRYILDCGFWILDSKFQNPQSKIRLPVYTYGTASKTTRRFCMPDIRASWWEDTHTSIRFMGFLRVPKKAFAPLSLMVYTPNPSIFSTVSNGSQLHAAYPRLARFPLAVIP